MISPNPKQFEQLAGQGNLVPVFQEQLADTETPVSVLARFADEPRVFLLESVEGGERWGRYSIIGFRPGAVFTVQNGRASLAEANGRTHDFPENDSPPISKLSVVTSMPRVSRAYSIVTSSQWTCQRSATPSSWK